MTIKCFWPQILIAPTISHVNKIGNRKKEADAATATKKGIFFKRFSHHQQMTALEADRNLKYVKTDNTKSCALSLFCHFLRLLPHPLAD